jgi:hypothetical protein
MNAPALANIGKRAKNQSGMCAQVGVVAAYGADLDAVLSQSLVGDRTIRVVYFSAL